MSELASQQTILRLTEASSKPDLLVGSLMRERATDPKFDQKLDMLAKHTQGIKQDTIVPGLPDTRYSGRGYAGGTLLVTDLQRPIVGDGLKDLANFTATAALHYKRDNPHDFFQFNPTYSALKDRLSDLKTMQGLAGLKDQDLKVFGVNPNNGRITNHSDSFDRQTNTAREIYATFSAYRDTFPDKFAKTGEKLYEKFKEDRDVAQQMGKEAREKVGDQQYTASLRKHYQEFSSEAPQQAATMAAPAPAVSR